MTPWLAFRRTLDRFTLYLPLLVMGVLALGSWWLVRSMPALWNPDAPKAVRKDPDYHLEHFSTQVFDLHGRRIRQVSGEQARHYPESDELHIDAVRFDATNEQGVELQATARRGVATGDGERVTLLGQVRVVRQAHGTSPRMELRGERVVALQSREQLLSDDPVEIFRGEDRFTAATMDFDMKTGQYQLVGRVTGLLQPRPRP